MSLFVSASECEKFTSEKKTSGRFKTWGFHIYDIEYMAQGQYPKVPPYALELTYKRTIKGSRILDSTEEEMLRVGGPKEKVKEWVDKLKSIFPDVKDGDKLRGFVDKDQKTYFCQPGKDLGVIADPEFATYFFGIWLDERTRSPDVRQKLLGIQKD